MPIDTHKQLQDLLRTAEAFRVAMIESGAVRKVEQNLYFDQLRAIERALRPANYLILDPLPIETLIEKMRGLDGSTGNYVEYLVRQAVEVLECWSIVERLRASEGAEVSLFCDNPEPIAGTSPNNAIEICDDWTGWKRRRFEGDSILDALRGAKAARDAHVEIQKVRDNG